MVLRADPGRASPPVASPHVRHALLRPPARRLPGPRSASAVPRPGRRGPPRPRRLRGAAGPLLRVRGRRARRPRRHLGRRRGDPAVRRDARLVRRRAGGLRRRAAREPPRTARDLRLPPPGPRPRGGQGGRRLVVLPRRGGPPRGRRAALQRLHVRGRRELRVPGLAAPRPPGRPRADGPGAGPRGRLLPELPHEPLAARRPVAADGGGRPPPRPAPGRLHRPGEGPSHAAPRLVRAHRRLHLARGERGDPRRGLGLRLPGRRLVDRAPVEDRLVDGARRLQRGARHLAAPARRRRRGTGGRLRRRRHRRGRGRVAPSRGRCRARGAPPRPSSRPSGRPRRPRRPARRRRSRRCRTRSTSRPG